MSCLSGFIYFLGICGGFLGVLGVFLCFDVHILRLVGSAGCVIGDWGRRR